MKNSKKVALCAFTALMCMASAVPCVSRADTEHKSEWFKDEKGRIFYYDSEGNFLTGQQEIDGEKYLFSANGVLKTGWRTVDGQRRYYDTETGRQLTGWIEYCGKKFYVDSEKGKVTGFFIDSDTTAHITDEKGSAITDEGLVDYNGNTYYINNDGNAESGFVSVDDDTYFFDGDFTMSADCFMENDGNVYYFNADGKMAKGFQNINSLTYCFDENGIMLKGINQIDGKYYFFSETDGHLNISDWATTSDGKTCYSYSDGSLLVGWWSVGGSTYYFDGEGTLAKGLSTIDDDVYLLDDVTGARLTGWQTLNGEQYYFSVETGRMLTGWWNIQDEIYYFNKDGVLLKGLVEFTDGSVYLLDDTTGARLTGWQDFNGKRYYFNTETGKMTTGALNIDGATYYFLENGTMLTGWLVSNGDSYYFSTYDGKMLYGWQTIGENEYFFDENGIMLRNTTIDGKNLGDDGTVQLLSAVELRAKNIIAQIGTSTEAIYNYVCINNKYSQIEDTKSLAQINSIGWGYFANYAMDNRFVVCYYYAAITDILLKQAGWQSRVVYGTGHGAGDHYWNQVYANGQWYDIDTCNGYYMTNFAFLQTKNYTFYQYVYPTYN